MKLTKILLPSLIACICTVLIIGIIVLLRISTNPFLFKFLFFTGYSSFILAIMYALIAYCKTCPLKLERILVFTGFLIILFGFITFMGFFNANLIWNISISLAIIYLLMIELQLIGWTDIKQSISVKITFLLALVSNAFLAYIFIFKIPRQELIILLYSASFVSILMLFYGIYFYQSKKEIQVR